MGSDDIFKNRKRERQKRKREYRQPKANSFLIITEGKKTEPHYFNGLKRLIVEKIGGCVDVVDIEVRGEGRGTNSLIEKTDEIVGKSKKLYQNIWVVFDKDDFSDFDEAVRNGQQKGYKIAWSNQSFEYWLFLHFEYSDSGLHRDDWNGKLTELFAKYNLGDGIYRKNYEEIYEMMERNNRVDIAVKNARKRMNSFDSEKGLPSNCNPGTRVHILVEELRRFLKE